MAKLLAAALVALLLACCEAEEQQLYPDIANFSVVYTWVNGSDTVLLDEMKQYMPNTPTSRIRDRNELMFSLRSIEKHMPWYTGPVYVVTNHEPPVWMNLDNPRLIVVSHKEIWADVSLLPTFNSASIELHFNRLPGVGNKLLYFNDEFFLGSACGPEEFWDPQGRPRPRTTAPVHTSKTKKKDPKKLWFNSVHSTHDMFNEKLPGTEHFFVRHAPIPMMTEALDWIWETFPEKVMSTLSNRNRNANDIRGSMSITWAEVDLGLSGASYIDQDKDYRAAREEMGMQEHEGTTYCQGCGAWLTKQSTGWVTPEAKAMGLSKNSRGDKDPNDYNFVKIKAKGKDKASVVKATREKLEEVWVQRPKFYNLADWDPANEIEDMVGSLLFNMYPEPSSFELPAAAAAFQEEALAVTKRHEDRKVQKLLQGDLEEHENRRRVKLPKGPQLAHR